MKILLKILCAPMIAVLSVFVWLASKLVQVSAVVMNFIAIAVGLGALCILFDGKTAQGICGISGKCSGERSSVSRNIK